MSGAAVQTLSVVVPCCNEAGNLPRFPSELFEELNGIGVPHEVVFVDDGSTDDTFQGLSRLAVLYPNTTLRRHERNRGLGASLRTGFAACRGDAIVTLDADLTFHPKEIPALLAAYVASVDAVIGSAFQGRMAGVHPVRRFLSAGVNAFYRLLLNAPITATSSIFRLYRAAPLRRLDLRCDSFDINAEILIKLLLAGGKAVEVPVTLGRRTAGVSKINVKREIFNHVKMFGKLLWWRTMERRHPGK